MGFRASHRKKTLALPYNICFNIQRIKFVLYINKLGAPVISNAKM